MNKFFGLTNATDGKLMGMLSSTNAKAALRALSSRKDVETLAEPEVVTTSGRRTQMRATQVVTVVINLVFRKNGTYGSIVPQTGTNGSISPQTETVETGPVLDVVSYVLADGYIINLTITPSLTEFLGYDSTTNTAPAYNKKGERIDVPKILPIIRQQQLSATVNLWDGQTAILGGMTKKNVIKDKVPQLGDLPWIGSLFRKRQMTESDILVFVTAEIVDPAGNRVHADDELPFAQTGIPPPPPPPK